MENSATELLEKFRQQKVSQESEVLQAAQRFVNQYRALNFFDSSFVQQFNAQLVACTPDVRRFFTSIMGGNEVLNYLEFLEKQYPQATGGDGEMVNQSDIAADGYLPSADADLDDGACVSKDELSALKEQQKILMEQTQQLMRQLKIQQATSGVSPTSNSYSEILDD